MFRKITVRRAEGTPRDCSKQVEREKKKEFVV
jgi:hypothetical protein